MVPPAVCWSGQPVALVDKIECSFNGVERQPGWSLLPAGERTIARISLLFPATQGKKSNSMPNPAEFIGDILIQSTAYGPCSGKISAYREGGGRETGRYHLFAASELGIGYEVYAPILASTWRQPWRRKSTVPL